MDGVQPFSYVYVVYLHVVLKNPTLPTLKMFICKPSSSLVYSECTILYEGRSGSSDSRCKTFFSGLLGTDAEQVLKAIHFAFTMILTTLCVSFSLTEVYSSDTL